MVGTSTARAAARRASAVEASVPGDCGRPASAEDAPSETCWKSRGRVRKLAVASRRRDEAGLEQGVRSPGSGVEEGSWDGPREMKMSMEESSLLHSGKKKAAPMA